MNYTTGNSWTVGRRLTATTTAILLSASLLLTTSYAEGQQPPKPDSVADLKKAVEALKKGQADIQKQLLEIQRLLQNRAAAPAPRARPAVPQVAGVELTIGDRPFKGENTAPLTLVEFTDYQ